MRATRSGAFEYQLEAAAQNIYLSAGACNPSYVCMIMGDKRPFTHYDPYGGRLAEGEVVLGDCAPDYRYSTSDIARIWPVNGEFSPAQRAFYDFPLAFQECVLVQVKPGATCQALVEQVHTIRRPIFQTWAFFCTEDKAHAELIFQSKCFSHAVGMAVHDIGFHFRRPFEIGMVSSCEPGNFDQTGRQPPYGLKTWWR